MTLGLQWIVDKITFPSPPSSYSLTSHPELFFIPNQKSRTVHPGVPCMLYAVRGGAPVLLVHAHSNGCDIGDMRQTLQSISDSLKVHVMSFEFPGYGLHLGTANMRSIDETVTTVLNYIANDLEINLAQVVWYGRSIGSGPAIRAVHRISKELKLQPGGVVLQCGFANFPEVAGHLFGRVAKRLVSRLWPNEAMMKELNCPVLLIHGSNDTMIPIQQSEKLWEAVALKDASYFHKCECGHNDFNFRRCTLRPIYDFLCRVISRECFPSTNFHVEVDSARRACVHHIGPLRSRIPVYSFRRPDLEDWLRRISSLAKKGEVEAETPAASPMQAVVSPEAVKPLATEESNMKVEKTNEAESTGDLKNQPPAAKRPPRNKKGKGPVNDQPPLPDYSVMPPIEDVEKALLDPEGMVQTCAARVSLFLDRLQRQLDRVSGLEQKSLEEVADMVEAEFWTCDPLLCLWEEVSLPSADVVRYRLGPFSIDNHGQTCFSPGLSSGRSTSAPGQELLRVPLQLFQPLPAHFRCLAEWSLVNSPRLQKLPTGKSSQGSCCCVPQRQTSKKSQSKESQQPTKGALATMLAAHFVNWVEKNAEIRNTCEKFVRLYKDPAGTLSRLPLAASVMARVPPQEMAAGDAPVTPCSVGSTPAKGFVDEELVWPPNSLETSGPNAAPEERGAQNPASVAPLPWPAHRFSAMARSHLALGIGVRCQTFVELGTRLRCPAAEAVLNAERQEGQPLPNLADFASTAEYVANSSSKVVIAERYSDWAVAGLMLHYERLLAGAGPTGEMPASPQEEVGDPTRLEVRQTALTLNKAVKVFAHADLRERREQFRQQQRLALRQIPQFPSSNGEADGNPESLGALLEEGQQSAQQVPVSVTPSMPGASAHIEGL
eukprot:TRINITY_DN18599_c0_g1_i1.p1 TRINITY_DN18599_c0_g1~~TRINITY_DN18599_c0_g1_i1.p1  ORF type:complete len:887 (-),score=138.77 TRINITY_DN18599_c0_g1_i1:163-2823(-)